MSDSSTDGADAGRPDRGAGSRDGPNTPGTDAPAPSPRQQFLRALSVRRNAKAGLVAGFLFAAAVYVFFVVVPGTRYSPLLFVGLWFVVFATSSAIVAATLTVVTAVRLSRDVE